MIKGPSMGELPAGQIRPCGGELKRRLGDDFDLTLKKYEDKIGALIDLARVKYSAREAAVSVTEAGVRIGDIEISSPALSRHLSGFGKCAVIALTLGIDTDRFIKRCAVQSQAMGFVADAFASAPADSACYQITEELFGNGQHTSPFAPGYADTDVRTLPPLLNIADPGRTLGISFTDSHLMLPTKSIIVIVGKM